MIYLRFMCWLSVITVGCTICCQYWLPVLLGGFVLYVALRL